VTIASQTSRVIREPLVQFALIGIVVFLLYPQDDGRRDERGETLPVIEVSQGVVDRLAGQFQSTWTRPPTETEMAGMIESHVREEVLYREAQALGLDQDDPVIRQRLQLKMEFIGEAAAAAMEPDDTQLGAWYAEHAAEFAPAAEIAFEQVMLSGPAEAAAVRSGLEAGADPGTLGRTTMLPAALEGEDALAVDGIFGPGFFAAVAALPEGAWAGPVESAFGLHLVRRGAVTVPEVPPLAEVRDAVLSAWRGAQAKALRDAQYAGFRARYDVRLPEAAQ